MCASCHNDMVRLRFADRGHGLQVWRVLRNCLGDSRRWPAAWGSDGEGGFTTPYPKENLHVMKCQKIPQTCKVLLTWSEHQGVYWIQLAQSPVTNPCEHGSEASGSIQNDEFLDQLGDCEFLKMSVWMIKLLMFPEILPLSSESISLTRQHSVIFSSSYEW